MIVTKDDILTMKKENNIERFLKSRVNVGIYFKYLWVNDDPIINRDRVYMSVEFPKVNRMFV